MSEYKYLCNFKEPKDLAFHEFLWNRIDEIEKEMKVQSSVSEPTEEEIDEQP